MNGAGARVIDQNPQFLQFVDRSNLRPGAQVVVKKRDELADSVAIASSEGTLVTLGSASAAKILVEAV